MSTERIQSILQQIKAAKDQAFRAVVRAAAENLAEEAQDESKDIRDSILDLQSMIHSAYREINEQEESFFKLPFFYKPQWFRAYEAWVEHRWYPALTHDLMDIALPWARGELVLIGAYQHTWLDVIPLRMAYYAAMDGQAPVSYISFDRKWETLRDQIIADDSHLPTEKLNCKQKLSDWDRINLESTMVSILDTPLYLTKYNSESLFDLSMALKSWVQDHGEGVVFIESIRTMNGCTDGLSNEKDWVLAFTRQLKNLAMELNITIVAGVDLPLVVCNVPELLSEGYGLWESEMERFTKNADHVLLISPSAYCDFKTYTTEGEMIIAKYQGSFIRKVVYL